MYASPAGKHFPECSRCPITSERRPSQAGRTGSPRLARCQSINLARSLIRPKEEKLLLLDWPAQRKPKLVLLEDGARLAGQVQKEIIGVKHFVTEELKSRPVEA